MWNISIVQIINGKLKKKSLFLPYETFFGLKFFNVPLIFADLIVLTSPHPHPGDIRVVSSFISSPETHQKLISISKFSRQTLGLLKKNLNWEKFRLVAL